MNKTKKKKWNNKKKINKEKNKLNHHEDFHDPSSRFDKPFPPIHSELENRHQFENPGKKEIVNVSAREFVCEHDFYDENEILYHEIENEIENEIESVHEIDLEGETESDDDELREESASEH